MADARRFRPSVESLAERVVPAAWPTEIAQAVGAADGGLPVVHLFEKGSNREADLLAYDPAFRGGVRTALGDVNGDGVNDIVTGAGPGGGPHVKAFDGRRGAELRSFFAFDPAFRGGVEVAAGDVNRDGYDDIIVGAGAGGDPQVRVFDGKTGTEVSRFFAFEPAFRGGVYVAAGDVNRDGYDDVIVGAGAGGGPRVRALDLRSGGVLADFFAYDPRFTGGARVASGDLNGDGVSDVITAAGPGGGPHVKAFDSRTGAELRSFFAADPNFTGGVRLAITPKFDGPRDGLVTRTRTGELVETTTHSLGNGAMESPLSVWVGEGNPPADLIRSVFVSAPPPSGSPLPYRTIEGMVTAVAADQKSVTILRGDGTPVRIDLVDQTISPPPPGSVFIDGGPLPDAEILLGDQPVAADQIQVGRWVRVMAGRASDPIATRFTALRVRLL
ncbi:MAG: VCBS repeat-containing protein [Fimbriiglobus sp.]|jgi:hypothetical protein|nr:VCBS repeat-containing protein [Fimbriiglobus sp.]